MMTPLLLAAWDSWLGTFERSPYWLEVAPWCAAIMWLAAVGGCFGSFLHVVWFRAPQGKDVVFTPSHCPICHHRIRRRHNLPLLGYLLLRGRCYDCKAPIPARYWWWELFFAALFVAAGFATPWL